MFWERRSYKVTKVFVEKPWLHLVCSKQMITKLSHKLNGKGWWFIIVIIMKKLIHSYRKLSDQIRTLEEKLTDRSFSSVNISRILVCPLTYNFEIAHSLLNSRQIQQIQDMGASYIFKGGEYWKFVNTAAQPGYPKSITEDFPGIPDYRTTGLQEVMSNLNLVSFSGNQKLY